MDFKVCEAERKFWKTPELIERLLLFLDVESTLCLAQSHARTLNILEGGWVWNKFIKRICPYDEEDNQGVNEPETKLDIIKNLVAILKLMEDPQVLLVDLLELICERVCSKEPNRASMVSVLCTRHSDPHTLPLEAFVLLEEVEGAFGTTEQKIVSMFWAKLKTHSLTAVISRLSRQHEKLTLVGQTYFDLKDREDTELFLVFMQFQPGVERFLKLNVTGPIGEDGWAMLAMALENQTDVCIVTSKADLDLGRKEDMKKIWNSIREIGIALQLPGWILDVDKEVVDWTRLEQILDMTEDEFSAEVREDEEIFLEWAQQFEQAEEGEEEIDL